MLIQLISCGSSVLIRNGLSVSDARVTVRNCVVVRIPVLRPPLFWRVSLKLVQASGTLDMRSQTLRIPHIDTSYPVPVSVFETKPDNVQSIIVS